MSKFKVFKQFSLAALGDEWKDCYLRFQAVSFEDSIELEKISAQGTISNEKALQFLENHFVEGKAIDEKSNTINVFKEDLKDFPVETIVEIIKFLSGNLSKNG